MKLTVGGMALATAGFQCPGMTEMINENESMLQGSTRCLIAV